MSTELPPHALALARRLYAKVPKYGNGNLTLGPDDAEALGISRSALYHAAADLREALPGLVTRTKLSRPGKPDRDRYRFNDPTTAREQTLMDQIRQPVEKDDRRCIRCGADLSGRRRDIRSCGRQACVRAAYRAKKLSTLLD